MQSKALLSDSPACIKGRSCNVGNRLNTVSLEAQSEGDIICQTSSYLRFLCTPCCRSSCCSYPSRMSTKIDISSLEGWLVKKRGPGKQKVLSILSGDSKRWFQVKELVSSDSVDVTLCYFKSQHEMEARGWIYLKDVTELYENGKTITIVSMARSITIEAKSRAEHKFWLDGITLLCPFANKSQGELPRFADDKSSTSSSAIQVTSRRGSQTESKAESKTGESQKDKEDIEDRQNRMAESKESFKGPSVPDSARSSASSRDEDNNGNSNKSRDGGDGSSRNNRFDRGNSRDRDDHRLSTFSNSPTRGNGNEGATSRLHNHIRKEIPPVSSNNSINNSQNSQDNLRSGGSRRTSMREDKPTEEVIRIIKPAPRASFQSPSLYNNSINDDDDDDDIETLDVSTESQLSRNTLRQRMKERRETEQRNQRRGSSDEDERMRGNYSGREQIREQLEMREERNDGGNNNSNNDRNNDMNNDSESDDGRMSNNENNIDTSMISQSDCDGSPQSGGRHPESLSHFRRKRESKREEDSDDDEMNRSALDLMVEKERRFSKTQAQAEEKDTPTIRTNGPIPIVRGRPPLPPSGAKPNPYISIGKLPPSSTAAPRGSFNSNNGSSNNNNQVNNQVASDVDLHEDWDDDDDHDLAKIRDLTNKKSAPVKNHSVELPVSAGVRADSNWLDENFDED